jgi:hypothetical protein
MYSDDGDTFHGDAVVRIPDTLDPICMHLRMLCLSCFCLQILEHFNCSALRCFNFLCITYQCHLNAASLLRASGPGQVTGGVWGELQSGSFVIFHKGAFKLLYL